MVVTTILVCIALIVLGTYLLRDDDRDKYMLLISFLIAVNIVACILMVYPNSDANSPKEPWRPPEEVQEPEGVDFECLITSIETSEVDEIQSPFMYVDLSEYLTDFVNVAGYLKVDNTDIDTPIVQAKDNEYYLDRGYFDEPNEAGTIFGDYRNNFEYLDKNNIIYGHNMANGTMFGTLTNLSNATESYIYFNSKGYRNVFKVYSAYTTDLTSFNFIQTGFQTTSDFKDFVDRTKELNQVSAFSDNLTTENVDTLKLLTLSTCVNGGQDRFVVHAYLYNREVY